MSCMSALYTFNTASLSDIYFANIFSHPVGCVFILLIVSFTEQKSFSLIQYQMFVFGVVSFAFRVRTPQKPLSVMRRSLPPKFQVLSPFWVNYFIQCKIMMQFHLFAYCLLIYPSAWSTLLFTQTHAIESVMPSSHLILCRPLLLLPQIPPSIRVFSNESTLHMRWPKYWSFTFSISPSKEHWGLISFRID